MAATLPSPTECCQRCCPDETTVAGTTDPSGIVAYDTKAMLRAELVRFDRMFVAVLGGVTLGDGEGGQYYFDEDSLAADDDGVTIRPDDLSALQPGRWRMFGS